MAKVFCACGECKHNEKNVCKAKEIELRSWKINTVNYGMKRMEECKTYEPSVEFKRIQEAIEHARRKEAE